MSTKVEDLNGASICAIHLKVRYHSCADGALLGMQTLPLIFVSQGIHMVDALLQFRSPTWLSLANIPAEIAIRDCLYALRQPYQLLRLVRVIFLYTLSCA